MADEAALKEDDRNMDTHEEPVNDEVCALQRKLAITLEVPFRNGFKGSHIL